jgi:hypothetical protein
MSVAINAKIRVTFTELRKCGFDEAQSDSSSQFFVPLAPELFRSWRRIGVLSGGLCRWIGRCLLTAGTGPQGDPYDNYCRKNSGGNNAGIPVTGPIRSLITRWICSRRQWVDHRWALRAGVVRVLVSHRKYSTWVIEVSVPLKLEVRRACSSGTSQDGRGTCGSA